MSLYSYVGKEKYAPSGCPKVSGLELLALEALLRKVN